VAGGDLGEGARLAAASGAWIEHLQRVSVTVSVAADTRQLASNSAGQSSGRDFGHGQNLTERSRMKKQNEEIRSPKSTRLRACWAVHAPSGPGSHP
jgi:hypothetical protein